MSLKPNNQNSPSTLQTSIEKEPLNLKVGVEISGLSKVFGEKIAVNNLNMKMYEGQVMSLLGHNGAGWTFFILFSLYL